MRLNFSKTATFIPTFNGNNALSEKDRLTATLTVMDMGDLIDLVDALQRAAGGATVVDTSKINVEGTKALITSAAHFLPKYVALSGAEDFTMEDVVKYPAFFPLAQELLVELSRISSPTEQDVKN